MNRKYIIGILAVLIIGFGIGYFVWGKGTTDSLHNEHTPYKDTAHDVDQTFILQMIPHHAGAIAMAELIGARSSRPEIQSLARGIVDAQRKEIDDMKKWYLSWYGSSPASDADASEAMHQQMEMYSQTLADALPEESDEAFLDLMIEHHEMAVHMATELKTSAQHPELKQLAGNIITSQSREISMMLNWLKAWYGR
jgi:uncharacterized protein (DUF305 family)